MVHAAVLTLIKLIAKQSCLFLALPTRHKIDNHKSSRIAENLYNPFPEFVTLSFTHMPRADGQCRTVFVIVDLAYVLR